MIRAVLFDLDGTLFDRDRAIEAVVRSQCERFRAALSGVSDESYVERVLGLDDHGSGDKRQLYQTIVAELNLPFELASELEADFWKRYHDRCEALPQALETLTSLRELGLRIAVVTNGRADIQERTIDRIGIRACLDDCLISELEALRKPDVEIFLRAASRLGVQAAECAFVGDHPVSDVAGALAAGMFPIWIETAYREPPDGAIARVSRLSEIPRLLANRDSSSA